MTKQQKELVKLTLMSFENNSSNIRSLRNDGNNKFTMTEIKLLLNIENKLDDVKRAMMKMLIISDDNEQNRMNSTRVDFTHDNVD
jgi:hypothetical protein